MQDYTSNTYENSEDIGVLLSNIHSSSKPSSLDRPGEDHPLAGRAANGPQEDQAAGPAAGVPAEARDVVHLQESKRSERDGRNIVSDVYTHIQKKPKGDKLTAGTVQAQGAVGEVSVTGVLCLLRVCCASYKCVRYRRAVSVAGVFATGVMCPLQACCVTGLLCPLQMCCVHYRYVVSVTDVFVTGVLCPLQACCVRYRCVVSYTDCYRYVVSFTGVLCPLQVCCVRYTYAVFRYRCVVSVTCVLCLLLVCCVCYRCVVSLAVCYSVTGVLCPLQVCYISYRCAMSVKACCVRYKHLQAAPSTWT